MAEEAGCVRSLDVQERLPRLMEMLTAYQAGRILTVLPEQTGSGSRRRDSQERKGNQKPCETWKPGL